MSADPESIPLSALQHYAFCPRQCALIHIERVWSENVLTAEGRVLHDRVHEQGCESRRDVRVARALPLQSNSLGIHGVADVVEFHRQPDGTWAPFPVEFKRGRAKAEPMDEVQLCAQALCLEEMMCVSIPSGALFYGKAHRRHDVCLSVTLRGHTRDLIGKVRALLSSGMLPTAEFAPRCRSCSLIELCQPRVRPDGASAFVGRILRSRE